MMIKINVAIILLISVLIASTLSKALVSNKIIVALNCGSKEEAVDAHDKVFKYQPVRINIFRTKSM